MKTHPGQCAIEGCERVEDCRGLCKSHYVKMWRLGLLVTGHSIEERFQAQLRKSADGCWEWTGLRDKDGYGRIKIGGRRGVNTRTHRLAYELYIGAIPPGLFVCHRCDKPSCVNPLHLFLGTCTDNVRDMREKGRGWYSKRRGPIQCPHCNHVIRLEDLK